MTPLVDPQRGDFEDDASSTKQRSLFAIAGSLLAEISLPKLLAAWLLLIVLPGILLGLAPFIGSAWLAKFSRTLTGFAWRDLADVSAAARCRFGLVWRAAFVSRSGAGFLVPEFAGGPAVLCTLPRGITASVGASDAPVRCRRPRASAGGKRRGRRH